MADHARANAKVAVSAQGQKDTARGSLSRARRVDDIFLHLPLSAYRRIDLLLIQRQPHGHELGRIRFRLVSEGI
jgi:hypothetical protein